MAEMQKDCRNNPCLRFASALNLKIHLHMLVPDGAYTFADDQARLHRAPFSSEACAGLVRLHTAKVGLESVHLSQFWPSVCQPTSMALPSSHHYAPNALISRPLQVAEYISKQGVCALVLAQQIDGWRGAFFFESGRCCKDVFLCEAGTSHEDILSYCQSLRYLSWVTSKLSCKSSVRLCYVSGVTRRR